MANEKKKQKTNKKQKNWYEHKPQHVELMFLMDTNLKAGEFGKIAKYKDLEIEFE